MKTILIVDDDKMILETLKDLIELIVPDSIILIAERGDKGISLFLTELPQIVFCDINLPDISGIMLIEKMRKESSAIKIIAMSGYDYKEDAIVAGADFFFKKPFEPRDLKKILVS